MKTICKKNLAFFLFIIFLHYTSAEIANSVADDGSVQAIQIVTLEDHKFNFQYDSLKRILESDDIKDRYVSIVSIAGAYREGKSFLLNFFLRYLYAQYKKHDVSDWLGEHGNSSELNGFGWRGGSERKTTGIWIWSEIFTYDYENGDKVAIMLLDTQGIFDDQTSTNECTMIFGLSTLISSVQCYNVMQGVQEDHLQHLQLFTEYSQLAMSQTSRKPFQDLLFIVRDWPYEFEYSNGWNPEYATEILNETAEQTSDMHELRSQIKSSFERIGAFLLPFPGEVVAQSIHFKGDLKQIDQTFRNILLKMIPRMFSPANLVIKKINGQKVRAREFVRYFQTYMDSFQKIGLLDAPTAYNATMQAYYDIQSDACLSFYNDSMRASLDESESYLSETELVDYHNQWKNETLQKFLSNPKMGSNAATVNFQFKLETRISNLFNLITAENEFKRVLSEAKANKENDHLIDAIKVKFEQKILGQPILQSSEIINADILNSAYEAAKNDALSKFEEENVGSANISNASRDKLKTFMDEYKLKLTQVMEANQESLNSYSNAMQNSINSTTEYYEFKQLTKYHDKAKNDAINQFRGSFKDNMDELTLSFQLKLMNCIEEKFSEYIHQNDEKRNSIIKDEEERRQKEIDQAKEKRERDEKEGEKKRKEDEERYNNMIYNENIVDSIVNDLEMEELKYLNSYKNSYVEGSELMAECNKRRQPARVKLTNELKGEAEIRHMGLVKFDSKVNNIEARVKDSNRERKAAYQLQQASYNNSATTFAHKPNVIIFAIITLVLFISNY